VGLISHVTFWRLAAKELVMTLKMQQTGSGRLAEKGIAITEFCGAPSGAKNQGI
jgi:hypothetical protein